MVIKQLRGMLGQPQIPLAAIEEWRTAADDRGRQTGHSERAARHAELSIARHVGDTARARRAYAAWLAAERDAASDCHACELHDQGSWQLFLGEDAEALRLWEPVLQGRHTCEEEPHGVLAASLLPLVRLGRTDEARAHHLHGHRTGRWLGQRHRVLAAHLEFCARTGNEPRALEILGAQAALWEPGEDLGGYLEWMTCTALLMRRLAELGHAQRPVPGPPGTGWTAVTLLEHAADEALAVAARFDERNGTPAVSDRTRTRMSAAPLLERLPLGLRTAGPTDGPASHPAADGDDPHALFAEARQLSEQGHPAAPAAWKRLDTAVEHAGTPLSEGERAELLDHRGMELARTEPAAGAALFTEAAALYNEAGLKGDAVACRARAALATAFAGDGEGALERIEPLCAEAVSLHAEGRAGGRQATAVLLTRARIRAGLLGAAEDPRPAARALDTELAELIVFAHARRDEPGVTARIAEATESRARLAAQFGDTGTAVRMLREAARMQHDANRPWAATVAELALSRTLLDAGEAEQAETALREALRERDGGGTPRPEDSARLRLALADVLAAQDRKDEEAEALAEAAHEAGTAGGAPGLGTRARLRLGGSHLGRGRLQEAAAVLEDVLQELPSGRGEGGDALQAHWWLGEALTGTGEHRAAAGEFLRAADTVPDGEDRYDHALLLHLAADAFKNAGAGAEAAQAYERADALWRQLGETHALVRALRSRAWLALGAGDVQGAIEWMGAALRETETALRGATADRQRQSTLRTELGHTYRQTAELLMETTDGLPAARQETREQDDLNRVARREAVVFADHAIAAFAANGEAGLEDRTGAELLAAWLEIDLDRVEAAEARARSVLDAYPEGAEGPESAAGESGGIARSRREDAATVLRRAGRAG